MDIIRAILISNVDDVVYLGLSISNCYPIYLSFENGWIEWTMNDSVPIKISNSMKRFDSFFAFIEWVENINKVCKKFISTKQTMEKLNAIVHLIQQHFKWYNFMKSYPVIQPKKIESFKSPSLSLYLSNLLVFDESNVFGWIKKCMQFLTDAKIVKDNENIETLKLEDVRARILEFESMYIEKWRPLILAKYKGEAKYEMYDAIILGKQSKTPYAAAMRFLMEKQRERDPKNRNEVMIESRLAKFSLNK